MSDESATHEPQDSDYDGAWKEALRLHFPEFVEKSFPAEHVAIDWSYEPQWMMRLPLALEERFALELIEFEEERKMPYVTTIERLAEERGEARSELRGKTSLVLAQLEELLGGVPEEQRDRIHGLQPDQIDLLGRDLVRFQSPADLQNWLERQVAMDKQNGSETGHAAH